MFEQLFSVNQEEVLRSGDNVTYSKGEEGASNSASVIEEDEVEFVYAFSAYSPAGEAHGLMVYVNYAREEDFR